MSAFLRRERVFYLTTTAGDFERETKSRRFNFVEAMAVLILTLTALWIVAYAGEIMGGIRAARRVAQAFLVVGAGYVVLVAPWLHQDSMESLGLGNPRALWQKLRTAPRAERVVLWAVVLSLFLVLNYAVYRHWGRLMGFMNLHRTPARGWDRGFPGLWGVFTVGSIVSLVCIAGCIRYDNFLPAFRTALAIALPLLALVVVAAFVHRGPSAFARFRTGAFASRVFGYLFWGFLQQWLFSSYFGTRLRKAFGPSPAPPGRLKRRVPHVLGVAAAGACAAAVFCLFMLRRAHGADRVSWHTAPVFAAFFFLPLLVCGALYLRDRRRLAVAALGGTVFGVFHLPSYGLVWLTFLLGVALSYVFMKDRNRNLVALGFVHGLLGSAQATLFRGRAAGYLAINRQVGPWHVRVPTWSVLVVPVLCLLLYAGLVTWYLRRSRREAGVCRAW